MMLEVKEVIEVAHEEYSRDPNGFEKLLTDAEKPLYEGCKKYTKLSTLVKLYNLKVRKEFANSTECPKCGQSRWKNVKDRNEERKKISSKVICEKVEDDKLRHSTDSPAWKLVDFKWLDHFGSEPRNLCLTLPVDGNSGDVQIDELGYVLVDLNKVGHKSDSFILVRQAKQVFYVEDLSDVGWSVVLTSPQIDFEDRYNDDELGDIILQCEGIPNDMPNVDLNNDLEDNISTYPSHTMDTYMDDFNKELGVGELNATVEEIGTGNETPKQLKRP
ncbi:uncharacterized protein E5676_scaffold142G004230 [Cucumis melo var. makuwa]|uniref:DUF4216 domain-containing protein n=1 Tax=Cucumis melo var. makuwa TaxID=1194695 RepID=A0A5A7TG00_CUCMM|nr:uncharacterized protein E6C27_scaffold460G00500 [Cucumis melo var. makuwa]TYK23359.1 uncharacterized protein E5676_scaffold142G004230 [Cucumis melo var. makuwa]